MSEYDASTYERFSGAVRRQVQSLRIILDNLQVILDSLIKEHDELVTLGPKYYPAIILLPPALHLWGLKADWGYSHGLILLFQRQLLSGSQCSPLQITVFPYHSLHRLLIQEHNFVKENTTRY